MNFLQRIQTHLCHESASASIVLKSDQNPAIRCEVCQNYPISDVYAFINTLSQENLWEACELAQLYYDLTKDDNIPIPFVLLSIEGILAKRVEGQSLKRLQATVQILKAINGPFTQDEPFEPPKHIMENFLNDYMNALAEAKKPQEKLTENEQTVLNHVLTHFHQILDFQNNKFDFYFEKLVPYVKACRQDWVPLPPLKPESNLIKQLLQQLQRSQAIRRMFSQYSVPFDIFHILVGCYACCTDIDMMANWALDFIVRVCRGEFFWKNYNECLFVKQMWNVLDTEISYKKNTEFHYVKRALQNGEGIESLSENFIKYMQMEKFVRDKLQVPVEFIDMVMHNLFPNVLFETPDMQMAFMIGMGHVANNVDLKMGQVRKGVFSKARRIYNILRKLIRQVAAFDAQYTIPWTIDTLKLFMVSDGNIDKDLTEIAQVVFEEEQE